MFGFETPYDDVLFWTGFVLILGGSVISLGGMGWHKAAAFLEYFGVNAKSGMALKVVLAGFAMLVVGCSLFYLSQK
ncbi:MAG: hypothetical protein HYY83_06840 [Deltaproteobacteria bacterium]|nr:hypothetical protein [Deltaproteobacteria bacterium]